MSGVEEGLLGIPYASVAAFVLTDLGQTQFSVPCGPTPGEQITLSYVDNDGNSTVSAGDLLRTDAGCTDSTVTMSFTVSSFDNVDGDLSGNGTFEARIASLNLTARGTFRLEFTASASQSRWVITDLAFTLTSASNAVERVTGATLVATRMRPDQYRLEFSGTVDSPTVGTTYQYSTPVPIEGTFRFFPTTGELVLTAGASKARITPTADTALGDEYFDLAIDASGGGYTAAGSRPWTALVAGMLFGWAPNQAPRITSLTIDPPNPTVATGLTALAFAHDPDGDPLQYSYEWRRNGVPMVGQTGPFLLGGFAKNDSIEVTLTVSDGRATTVATATATIQNSPPLLTGVELTPAEAYTNNDLTVTFDLVEADGDPLTVTYEWRRNGSVLAGATDATLPASVTERGDFIEVTVSATDGTVTTTANVSVTILDAPPTLSAIGAPAAASYGTLVTFDTDIADPDGEPVGGHQFELTHGPAGMTVDPITGAVTWLATPPMFDRTMTVRWGVTVNQPTAIAVTGAIVVEDPTRNYPLMRTGIEAPVWPAGLEIGDFNGDSDEEMLILSNRSLYELEADGAGGYRQAWMYPFTLGEDPETTYSFTNTTGMTAGDVDGDARAEIYVAAGESVFKLDGVERRPAASAPLGPYRNCRDLELADIDGVGSAELVCLIAVDFYSSVGGLIIFDATDLAVRWQFPDGDYGNTLDVGNVDQDSALEIITAKGYVFDGASYANEWLYGPGFGVDVDTGDLDGNGVAEIVAAVDWTALRAYSAVAPNKGPLWEVPRSDLDSLLVTNIDADAAAEILIGDGQWGNVTAYEYDAGSNTAVVIFEINSQDHGVSAIGVGDVDDDGALEFVWGTGLSSSGADRLIIAGRNPTIEVEWTQSDPAQLDGPFTGGALAGAPLYEPAPLFATARTDSGYRGTRLLRMHPVTGDLTVGAELGSNWNGISALAISDYDNDGTDEVFLGTSELYTGYLTAYDFFGANTEWTGPQLPSQQAVMAITHADVTGDGREELIAISTAGVVYVHDVFSQSVVWQSTTLGYGGRDVEVADVNDDGTPEILAVTTTGIYLYERVAGPVTYAQAAIYNPQFEVRDTIVADADGDGAVEVIVLMGSTYLYDDISRVERLDANLALLGSFQLAWRGEMLVLEPSAAARKNVIVPTADFIGPPSTMVAVDAQTGQEVWRSPLLLGQVQKSSLEVVEIGGDRRMSFGTQVGMYLTR
jgi:hypothetical protein